MAGGGRKAACDIKRNASFHSLLPFRPDTVATGTLEVRCFARDGWGEFVRHSFRESLMSSRSGGKTSTVHHGARACCHGCHASSVDCLHNAGDNGVSIVTYTSCSSTCCSRKRWMCDILCTEDNYRCCVWHIVGGEICQRLLYIIMRSSCVFGQVRPMMSAECSMCCWLL